MMLKGKYWHSPSNKPIPVALTVERSLHNSGPDGAMEIMQAEVENLQRLVGTLVEVLNQSGAISDEALLQRILGDDYEVVSPD